MFLIDDLLLSPISGFKFIMRTLIRTAEEQWNDDAPLKERLMELQVELDEGSISEDEYAQEEAAILQALRDIQNRKMEAAGFRPEEAPEQGLSGSGVTGTVEANLGWGPSESDNRKR
ncbi:MAG TPA: gas vesicle protein GvpG [Clostridia bacterium]|nr:gas vesicle protein GvpG [Clostridia bacterium]